MVLPVLVGVQGLGLPAAVFEADVRQVAGSVMDVVSAGAVPLVRLGQLARLVVEEVVGLALGVVLLQDVAARVVDVAKEPRGRSGSNAGSGLGWTPTPSAL